MTPEERRSKIKERIDNLGVPDNKVSRLANYTGLWQYLHKGAKASDVFLYQVEDALDRLEEAKAKESNNDNN